MFSGEWSPPPPPLVIALCKEPFLHDFNPLTPVPPVTGRDEPWPFFHSDVSAFDRNWHHLYPTSEGGKDLSNNAQIRVIGLMEPEICAKCSKSWVKNSIFCHYIWLLNGKNCPPRWCFLRSFLTASKPSRRAITAAKRKEKEKKEGEKNQKSKSLKT